MAVLKREDWQKIRDAAGFKKGYTKASIGDLLDQWHKALKPVAPNAPERLRTLLKTVAGPARTAELKSVVLALGPAAWEYVEKIKTDKGLVVIKHDTQGDVPIHDWGAPLNGKRQPVPTVVASLNEVVRSVIIAAFRINAQTDLVKACPGLKAAIDHHKQTTEQNKDPLPTRDEWKAHRDSAGLPAGYVKASIGDHLEALRKALGDLSGGLNAALGRIPDGGGKEAARAAQMLVFAAAEYKGKLLHEKKAGTPAMKNVVEDLEAMQRVSLAVIHDLGHPG